MAKKQSTISRGTKRSADRAIERVAGVSSVKPGKVGETRKGSVLKNARKTIVLKSAKPLQNPRPIRPTKPAQQSGQKVQAIRSREGSGNRRNESTPPSLIPLRIADTPMSNAFRHIEPTWRNYVYYVNLAAEAGDVDMKKFMASYEALPPKDRCAFMPERICDLSGVDPSDLIAAVSKHLWSHKQSESTITASVMHPRVIEHTALYGINHPDNYKDRELFLRATGTLPDKKGASIVINNTPQTANVNVPALAGSGMFRSMDQSVSDMSKLLDEPVDVNAITLPDDEVADLVFNETDESED